jgi:hypothetical protein
VNGFVKTLCILLGLAGVVAFATAQDSHIIVQVVDGRNGRPLANQHLLVFAGESPQSVRQHKKQFELVTDKEGRADLMVVPRDIQWIQVWVDWHVLCQSEPNSKSFSVAEILSTGLSTPNTCGKVAQEAGVGHLIVFARPAHFWEKMQH